MKLMYQHEAKEWVQALPIANGHMGAMAFGGTTGKFELSENTCWSGAPMVKCIDENAKEYMKQAREFLMKGDIEKGEELISKCTSIKENYGTQLPMGRLYAEVNVDCESQDRELDLINGVCTDHLYFNKDIITRQSFISNPAKVMCVKISTSGKQLPQLGIWAEGWSKPSKNDWQEDSIVVKGRALENVHSDGLHGVEYTFRVKLVTDGHATWTRNRVLIDNATTFTLYIACATSMFCEDMDLHCKNLISNALNLSWEKLYEEHCKEHSEWMNRCSLNLPKNSFSEYPTDQRLAHYRQDPTDYDLIATFFQYGRYVLLNSSRPDSLLPAALQGVWNDNRACAMEWTDDMHLDINTQMNYYPAEVTGLSECSLPLYRWIKERLMPNGKKIAKDLYNAEGFVAHTISNAYGWAAPGWEKEWGFTVVGGAWVALHIWEHYLYTKDIDFLKQNYDVLYQAGKFLCSILEEDEKTKELVICPSYSPENQFIHNGKNHCISYGSTLDMSVTKCVFSCIIEGAKLLDCEDEWTLSLHDTLKKLAPFKVGKYGQLQEWFEDYEEALPDHRHTSHLLAMHPLNLINPEKSPELKQAAVISLKRRLGENAQDIVLANWAGALLILYNARLLDGENAGQFLRPMMCFLSRDNLMITHEGPTTSVSGGIYELDGNTGFTAGVAEMLLQSYTGVLHILPAIPSAWTNGEYKGLCGYDGNKVDVNWDNEQVEAKVYANIDGDITVRYNSEEKVITAKKGNMYTISFKK